MDNNPLVSVITVCFNSERYLERSIKSLLAQNYSNIEHIIIDGGSKDGTLDIIKKYENHISYWVSEPDEGIYDAINKGINVSKGDILYVLHSDDRLYDKDVIKKVVDFFNKKEVDLAYGDILSYNLNSPDFSLVRYPHFITKRHFLRGTIGHPAVFLQRNSFRKVGNFDTKYKIASDYEWFLRALFKNHLRAAHMRRVISIFQCNGTSNDESNKDYILLEKKMIESLYFSSFEICVGKCINFFLYGDCFRFILRLIFRKRLYGLLASYRAKLLKCKKA